MDTSSYSALVGRAVPITNKKIKKECRPMEITCSNTQRVVNVQQQVTFMNKYQQWEPPTAATHVAPVRTARGVHIVFM
jgi:hypothetical protein